MSPGLTPRLLSDPHHHRCSAQRARGDPVTERPDQTALICRVQSRWCALPLVHVRETMRPLPIAALAAPVAQVLGLALIRGSSLPVVDLAALLGLHGVTPQRFVVIAVAERRVALAVSAVLGLRPMPVTESLPPLTREAPNELIAAIGWLDAELLMVLDSARLLPEELLQ